eukprot:jgi/Psemu1/209167/e_gw1.490.12.1
MAAILCTSIGELISKCCSALTLPCDLCGKVCGTGCDELGKLFCTPFFPYLAATFCLNTPAVAYAIQSIAAYSNDNGCSLGLLRWLIINGAFAVCHMVASMYIVKIIRAPAAAPATGGGTAISATTGLRAAEEGTTTTKASSNANNFYVLDEHNPAPGGANSYERVKHVLCYDKGMAIYIVVFLAWVVWMGMGVSRRLFDDGDCYELLKYVSVSLSVGYVWMGLVGSAFCCSLLCLR